MTRVATHDSYQSALLHLMNAQSRAQLAQERIASERIATDMGGYGRGAEQLTSLTSTQARIEGFVNAGKSAAARLETQDLAMGRIYEGGTGAREAIANSLAAGGLTNLMTELGLHYQTLQTGLNAQHQGGYLFSGGASETAPSTAETMAELAAAPSTAATFVNDGLKQKSRIDENTSVETGFLANELGGALSDVFRSIQAYQNGAAVVVGGVTYTPAGAGTITGKPTADVETFLRATLQALDAANTGVTNQTAKNGLVQNQVKDALDAHESQITALEKLMTDKAGYDPAQAVTDLQMAQVAIQASAQVINSLRQTSLLDLLR